VALFRPRHSACIGSASAPDAKHLWANQERKRFDELLSERDIQYSDVLAAGHAGNLLAWYGFLWSVIEAFEDRALSFAGRFGQDIAAISGDLRRLRNAVFHVPRAATLYDKRIAAFVNRDDSVDLVRRVHHGFGRLFLEHMHDHSDAGRA
jgi:hypothetical protein